MELVTVPNNKDENHGRCDTWDLAFSSMLNFENHDLLVGLFL